ncbi:MAG: hypothetical protein AB7E60_01895 [Sphingobium sp.]
MSEIAVGVRLTGDGSGLVGQLKLTQAEFDRLKAKADEVSARLGRLTSATEGTSRAQVDVANTAKAGQAELGRLAATEVAGATAARDLASATGAVPRAHVDVVNTAKTVQAELGRLAVAEVAGVTAARDLASATGAVSRAHVDSAVKAGVERAELDRLAMVAVGGAAAVRNLTVATLGSGAAMERAATGARSAGFQLSDLSSKSEAQVRAQRRLADASGKLTGNIGLQRAGWTQLGYQMQDIGIQYSMNTRLSQIMAMQSGQLFGAINMIAQSSENAGGKLGKFASIMGGPWGIAATVAISLGSALWSTLSKVDDASEDAAKSTINFSSSLTAQQSIVDSSTDGIRQLEEATRSLINTQAILLDNLQAVSRASVGELEGQLVDLDGKIAGLSKGRPPSGLNPTAEWLWTKLAAWYGEGDGRTASAQIEDLNQKRTTIARALESARLSRTRSQVALEERAAVERADPDQARRGEIERERARLRERRQFTVNLQRGDVPLADTPSLEQISAADFDRQMAELTRRENALKNRQKPKKDNSAAKAAREAERLALFGERAEEAIARLNDQFNLAPRDIDRARQATASLDDIIADLEKRKPQNFEVLIAQAQAVKPLIQDSLQRPIRDMLTDQARQVELGRLQLAGRQNEAAALQLTWTLMDKLGVESEEQLATELAKRGVTADQVQMLYDNLDVLRQQTREMRGQQELLQAFLTATGDMKENVRQTFEGLRRDGPKAVGDFFKRSMDVGDRLFADVITEKLFGGLFRDWEDQLTGADKVSKAGDKMANAVDRVRDDIGRAGSAIADLGKAASGAAAGIRGGASGAATDVIVPEWFVPPGWIKGDDGRVFDPDAPIEVTGKRPNLASELKSGFREGFESVFDDLEKGLDRIFRDVFGDKGLFSASLGKTLGQTFGHAQLGGTAGSLVTGLLGVKGSATGGMIGGAIGGAVGKAFGSALGPVGSIVGGVLGSLTGGLLKKTKYGTAALSGGDDADVSTRGNSSSREKASVGLASSVQDTLARIAEEFGGEVGSFNTSIGVYKKDYRVSTSGRTGKLKNKYGDVRDFGDDEAGAIAFATIDAIADGAIEGISDKVAKALRSSPDLDAAIAEALKVREVEQLLGGLTGELERAFKELENQAKERLRIAADYGFDILEIEKRNAEDRAKLVNDILATRIGSLQDMLDDFRFGDLFEGSLVDQREALLVEIAKARSAAEAGDDGAADTLANLSRRLIDLSRDAYGTAGAEYAADRDNAISAAEAVIKIENDRVKAAQDAVAAQNAKLDTANQLANEQADALVRIDQGIQTLITVFGRTISIPVDTSLVAR